VGGVELASVVRQLRAELNEALADAEGERLRFELGPVHVALSVTVGREGGAGGRSASWLLMRARMPSCPGRRSRRSSWC
jgi:Trypsin-co-occurring domain 2